MKHYEVVLRVGTVNPSGEYKCDVTVKAEEDVSFSMLLNQWAHRSGAEVPEVKARIPSKVFTARTLIMEVESAKSPDGRDVKEIAKEAME